MHAAESYEESLYVAAQLALRKLVGEVEIEELLARRRELGRQLTDEVAPEAVELGLQLSWVDVKDGELKNIFAELIRAKKVGQTVLERARGETAAIRNLANAAKMLEKNPTLLHLKLLQFIEAAGATEGSSLVLSLPAGLLPWKAIGP